MVKNHFVLYPNPANNNIHIDYSGMDGKAQLRLTDVTGRILIDKQIEVSSGLYTETLSIENLQNGIYQLVISPENSTPISTRIIKQ